MTLQDRILAVERELELIAAELLFEQRKQAAVEVQRMMLALCHLWNEMEDV